MITRGRDRPAILRLAPYDEHCLRAETPDRPLHVGILAILDGPIPAVDAGPAGVGDVLRELDRRTLALPRLRRIVRGAGLLAGASLWVDDPDFRIERHVATSDLEGADTEALLGRVEELVARPLDRDRPLWRLWMLTGLADGRSAILVVVHHGLADGMSAMRLARGLLRGPMAPGEPDTPARPSAVGRGPTWPSLVADNAVSVARAATALLRPATWRTAAGVVRALRHADALARRSPVSSLNAPVGPRRRLLLVEVDQVDVRRVAKAHDVGAVDVVLAVITGGVRALLEHRGEDVAHARPRAGVAVALFSPDRDRGPGTGNDIGTAHLELPVGHADPGSRLLPIAADRARAAADPMVAAEPVLRAHLGRVAFMRRSLERQRLVNLATTYLPGPPTPVDALGVRVARLVPIAPLAGNLGLSFVTLSYAGRLVIAVRADADAFPDLDVLGRGMRSDWTVLAADTKTPEGTVDH